MASDATNDVLPQRSKGRKTLMLGLTAVFLPFVQILALMSFGNLGENLSSFMMQFPYPLRFVILGVVYCGVGAVALCLLPTTLLRRVVFLVIYIAVMYPLTYFFAFGLGMIFGDVFP